MPPRNAPLLNFRFVEVLISNCCSCLNYLVLWKFPQPQFVELATSTLYGAVFAHQNAPRSHLGWSSSRLRLGYQTIVAFCPNLFLIQCLTLSTCLIKVSSCFDEFTKTFGGFFF